MQLNNIHFNSIFFLHAIHRWFCVVHLFYNVVQIFNPNFQYPFRVLKFLSILRLKWQFCQLFVKAFRKRFVRAVVFCCCSSNLKIVFFKQICHIIFELKSHFHTEILWVFKLHLSYILFALQIQTHLFFWS